MGTNCYPLIYKQKVVEFYKKRNNKTIKEITNIFGVSNGSLYGWIKKDKYDILDNKKKYTKVSKYTPQIKCYIRTYVLRVKVFNYKKLIELIKKNFQIVASKTAIYDILKIMKITRKKLKPKKVYGDANILKQKRKDFEEVLKTIDVNKIISIDETSIDTTLIPKYGWSIKGKKVEADVNSAIKRCTLICALSNTKVIHYEIIKGTTNAETFKNFIINLMNKITNGMYLLLDNARIHHSRIVKDYTEQTENKLLYSVPYSPDYNPIENIFSIIKNEIRKKNFTTSKAKLDILIKNSINKITETHLTNCFNRSMNKKY